MKRNDKLKSIEKAEGENAVGLKHGLGAFYKFTISTRNL